MGNSIDIISMVSSHGDQLLSRWVWFFRRDWTDIRFPFVYCNYLPCEQKLQAIHFFDWKKGTPLADFQAIHQGLTLLKQIENGKQLACNRKFITPLCQFCCIAPFGDSFVILAYIRGEDEGEKEFSSTIPSRQVNAQRPQVRVVTWNNDELSTDAFLVHGFEHYKAKDYSLAHAPFSGSSYAGGQWAAGDEPMYYIVSRKDVVIAKPRDAEDHISWLLQHGYHEKALAAVEEGQGRSELLNEDRFALREGGRTLGTSVVSKVIS